MKILWRKVSFNREKSKANAHVYSFKKYKTIFYPSFFFLLIYCRKIVYMCVRNEWFCNVKLFLEMYRLNCVAVVVVACQQQLSAWWAWFSWAHTNIFNLEWIFQHQSMPVDVYISDSFTLCHFINTFDCYRIIPKLREKHFWNPIISLFDFGQSLLTLENAIFLGQFTNESAIVVWKLFWAHITIQ